MEATLASDGKMENEVRKAETRLREALQQGHQPPALSIINKVYNLFSVDFVRHFYSPDPAFFRLPYVEFSSLSGYTFYDPSVDDPNDVLSHLWLGSSDDNWPFPTFSSPQHASLEGQVLRTDETFDVEFRFISNDYLIITVPRELVYEDKCRR